MGLVFKSSVETRSIVHFDVHILGRLVEHDFDVLARRDELDVALIDHQPGFERLRIADLAELGAGDQQWRRCSRDRTASRTRSAS